MLILFSFKDWDRQSPTDVVTEICGFVTILSGTFLLHKTKDMGDGTCFCSFRSIIKSSPVLSNLEQKVICFFLWRVKGSCIALWELASYYLIFCVGSTTSRLHKYSEEDGFGGEGIPLRRQESLRTPWFYVCFKVNALPFQETITSLLADSCCWLYRNFVCHDFPSYLALAFLSRYELYEKRMGENFAVLYFWLLQLPHSNVILYTIFPSSTWSTCQCNFVHIGYT